MPVADLEDVATRASAIATDGSRPASERVAELRRLRATVPEDAIEIQGRIATLAGSLELQREAEALVGATELLIARENADIREELLTRELATPDELDAAGYLSHETLDAKTEDGTLQEAFGLIDPAKLRAIAAKRHRDHGRFADEFSSLAEPKPLKGRGGAALDLPSIPKPKGTPGGIPGQRNQFSAPENPMPNPTPKPNVGKPAAPHIPDAAHGEFAADAGSSAENPIDVGGDIERAAKLLGEGKHVRLEQPHQVSTLLDRLAAIVKEAESKGDSAPNYDLCKVSVPKTNLFCAQSKGIKRLEMPQLLGVPKAGSPGAKMVGKDGQADIGPAFRDRLEKAGVKVAEETVPAANLRASQHELVGSKVAGMVGAARAGKFDPGETPIFVSSDDYIVDGHHRWAAQVGLDAEDGRMGDEPMNVVRVDMPITELLHEAHDFADEMGIQRQAATPDKPKLTDDHSLYIDHDPAKHPVVPVSALKRTKPDQPDSTKEAIRRMNAASRGEISKRKPIDVIDNGDGTYDVQDGNGTTEAAEVGGLSTMPVNVVGKKDAPAQPLADQMRGGGETLDTPAGPAVIKQDESGGWSAEFPDEVDPDTGDPEIVTDSTRTGLAKKLEDRTPAEKAKQGAVMPDPFTEEETSKPEQNFGTIEEMFDAAKEALPGFTSLLTEGVGGDLGAIIPDGIDEAVANAGSQPEKPQIVMGPLKKKERSMEKINGKYGGDHNRLQDVVRATIVVPKLKDMPGMVDAVRRHAAENGYEIRKAENRYLDPPPPHNVGATPSGYRDAAIALVSPNGVVTELQLNTAPMFLAKQGDGHTWYEESRKIEERMKPKSPGTTGATVEPGVTPEEVARLHQLEEMSTRLYDEAYKASL